MKTIFLILVAVFMVGTAFAVQPARRPFVKIKIDGTTIKTGDILTVTNGQKLKLEVDLEGGRKDYCKFPDTYADIAGTAQILSRGDNGISYILNDKRSEWKLLNQSFQFSSNEFIAINSTNNQPTAELIISDKKFAQSFVKIAITANWQFTEGETKNQEDNVAEAMIYFKIAGSSDVWFQSQNIKVSGVSDNTIQDKLVVVQAACDSIEHNMYHLKFSVVQQSIRNLQASITDLKAAIDAAKATNPSYKINVSFIGLPSDQPFNDIASVASIKNSWTTIESFLSEQKQATEKLSLEPTSENKKELVQIISNLMDWQSKLPEKTLDVLNKYIPEIHTDSIAVPEKFLLVAKQKSETDYVQTLTDFKAFMDCRVRRAPIENQNITTTNNRVQPIRLFDGMLRSYFNSISWAEWINTRE